MSNQKFNAAFVGSGFGAQCIAIYQKQPQANLEALCRRTRQKLDQIGDAFGVPRLYTAFGDRRSLIQGSGRGGSHRRLAHAFLSSIVKGCASFPDDDQSANWTMAGICARAAAMRGGQMSQIPDFRRSTV
jgi:hypothetical protein